MILFWIFLLLIFSGGILIYIGKKNCTCIGKECSADDGCGNKCCNGTTKCGPDGKCCSTDCTGKACDENNGCDDSCNFCSDDQECKEGNCQNKLVHCSEFSCDDSCKCPAGKICYEHKCCTPDDCSTGMCGGEGKCGMPPCSCNDRYCGSGRIKTGNCCRSGKCNYEDICESPASYLLSETWGKFCQRKDVTNPRANFCKKCKLENAIFSDDSLLPISGQITCESCTAGGIEYGTQKIDIDPSAGAYIVSNSGQIISQAKSKENCSNYPCEIDEDCTHLGCKNCIGGVCS